MSKGYKIVGDVHGRRCLTPHEFLDRVTRLRDLNPGMSETSGSRSKVRNRRVGGKEGSKHAIRMRIAQDLSLRTPLGKVMTRPQEKLVTAQATTLGLWYMIHNVGSGRHLHLQGLPVGPVPAAWWNRFGD